MPGMNTPQAGIFALGTSSHAYLEFDIQDAKKGKEFAATIAAIREPRTTTGGVNLVIGFRPELWRDIVPEDAPAGVEGFNKEIQGLEGFVMPSTQHDALVWLSGSAYDVIFDMARSVIHDLAGQGSLGEETSSWPYRHDRDLTGFIDGSENPMLLEAPIAALLPEGTAGTGGSVRFSLFPVVHAELPMDNACRDRRWPANSAVAAGRSGRQLAKTPKGMETKKGRPFSEPF
jgi:porphyrinogen peroxidase